MTITPPPSIDPTPTPAPVRNDRSTFSGRVDAFIAWLATGVTQIYNVAVNCYENATEAYNNAVSAASQAATASSAATNASASAASAAASAVTAVNAPGTSATSTTSLTIDGSNKTFTIQTGKSLVPGMFAMLAYTGDATKYVYGIVTAYNSGTGLTTLSNVTYNGSGTYANWTLSLSAPNVKRDLYINGTSQLVSNYVYIADSSACAFTATMPTNPANGDLVTARDLTNSWGVNNVTLDRNGQNFVNRLGVGVAENFTLSIGNTEVCFMFTALGWRLLYGSI